MIRKNLITANRIYSAVHMPRRCIQVRLHLQYSYDLIAIYQYSWNDSKGTQALCARQRQLWSKLEDYTKYIPNHHFLILSRNFNCPLQ